MGPIGVQEMIVIFLVALVLFGPKKLPELGKNIAKGIGEFKRAQSELKATFDREMRTLEQETASAREAFHQAASDITNYTDDITGSNSTYNDSHLIADSAANHSTPVGASEASSAELHAEHSIYNHQDVSEATIDLPPHLLAESTSAPVSETAVAELTRPAEGTVARGSITAKAEPEEANPLPELESGPDDKRSGANQELPNLV